MDVGVLVGGEYFLPDFGGGGGIKIYNFDTDIFAVLLF